MPVQQAPDLAAGFPEEDLPKPHSDQWEDLLDEKIDRAEELIERHDLSEEDLAALHTFQLTGMLRNCPMVFYGIDDPGEAVQRAIQEHAFGEQVLHHACGYDEAHYGKTGTLFSIVNLHMMSAYPARASSYGVDVTGGGDGD